MTPEAKIMAACVRLLNKRGADTWHFNLGPANGETGLPDRLIVTHGVAIALETKSATGQVRPKQAWQHERARKAGAVVCVARCADDLRAVLDAIDLEMNSAGRGKEAA